MSEQLLTREQWEQVVLTEEREDWHRLCEPILKTWGMTAVGEVFQDEQFIKKHMVPNEDMELVTYLMRDHPWAHRG